jgi:hypothetical protein
MLALTLFYQYNKYIIYVISPATPPPRVLPLTLQQNKKPVDSTEQLDIHMFSVPAATAETGFYAEAGGERGEWLAIRGYWCGHRTP